MSFIDRPLVSIGVPYYNSQNYIFDTLESIKNQTYENIELLLINDCSPDNSQAIVDNWLDVYRNRFANVVQIVNPANRGLAYSCKELEKVAKGIFFSKLDSDDIILPGKIAKQVNFLLAHPNIALVYSNTMLIDEKGNLLSEDYFAKQNFSTVVNKMGPSGSVFHQLLIEDFIPNPSVLIRKSILDSAGGYDETLFNEDWDLWLRIAKTHPVGFMEGFYSQYRIHSESMMRKSSSLVKVYASSIKALLKHAHISKEFDKVIAKHLFTYTIGMYRFGIIDRRLLKINLHFNKNIKSLIYYLMALLNIKINQKSA
ncbi:glycosyltransferase [Segetibacter sp.]|jgi:glycosyltransferase involved in cell wall biosynthesis|uniref:glycosyltransferase family 2 protein n=1 Tax=Segetibacter sp. TaxID=2231182 RepID=UPI00263750DF|nr:glycosyltransferase [Segetibacter sp.]MCW3079603.1 glycosyltransferase [Segetibacter sp.]